MSPLLRVTVRADGAMVAGALATWLLALPTRPRDPVGFEDLGWALLVIGVAAAVALLVGALALHHALRDHPGRGRTVLLFLVLAVALGSVTAGAGALLAAPLAYWLVGWWLSRG